MAGISHVPSMELSVLNSRGVLSNSFVNVK